MKYVSELSSHDIKELKETMKKSSSESVRIRAHSILLSSRHYSIEAIADIYEKDRDTISMWIDRWEVSRIDGLSDEPRSGCPPILDNSEKEIAINLLKEHPRSVKKVIGILFEKTGKSISQWTLKRIAQANRLAWKRIKKSTKSNRNEEEFQQAKQEIQELKEQEMVGKIDLYSYDESGFSLTPVIPYAWQPIGENIEVSSVKSKRLNVVGFINRNNNFQAFTFDFNIDSDVVIACFDEFSKTITKETVVLMDNAPTHTSQKFNDNIEKWKKMGLVIKRIPAYSPELNFIEILWRFIKYWWLPFSAYLSFENLVLEVETILKNVGTKYRITYA